MKCEYCNCDLTISNNKMKTELESTDVMAVQTLVCTNSKCKIYCGTDLQNPFHVARTVETKVN